MRIAFAALPLICLPLLALAPVPAPAQNLPEECREAMETRSPQGQVDLFTRCLGTGALSGKSKATTLKQRAIAYMHLGRHQFALDDANQALKLTPDDADVYYLRGFAYRALGQYQRAVEESSRAIAMDANFAAAYANRAFAHHSLGNLSQARSDAARAKALDPSVKVPRL